MGKQCGIMRVEKRGRGAVYGLQLEANRTKDEHDKTGRDFDDSDIMWDKTGDNIHLVQTENWNKEITRQIHDAGIKERKDAIVMLDGLYTASDIWFYKHSDAEALQYFKDCLAFHVKEYCGGDASRVINAVIHLDEKVPHMQVASVPLVTDEKGAHLSAKTIMGGRADYRTRQDRFYDEVTKDRGLDRGEVREPAERKLHTTKREWQIATQDDRLKDAQEQVRQAQIQLTNAQQALLHVQEEKCKEEANTKLERANAELERANAEQTREKNKVATEELAKILKEKAEAAEIHHAFGNRDRRTYYGDVADEIYKVEETVRKNLEEAQKTREDVATREKAVSEKEKAISDRERETEAKRQWVDELYENAQEAYKNAQRRELNQQRYIDEAVQKKIDEIFTPDEKSYTKRLEKFCKNAKDDDGRSMFDNFKQQERKRALKEEWER